MHNFNDLKIPRESVLPLLANVCRNPATVQYRHIYIYIYRIG